MLKKGVIFIVATALFADYFLLSVVIPILPHVFEPTWLFENVLGATFCFQAVGSNIWQLVHGIMRRHAWP